MLKHVSCDMSKQEILKIIVKEYDKAYKEAEQHNTLINIWREEALRDLVKQIPIYEYN